MLFAFLLESVGSGEWLLLLAVILIVVGPRNLPSAARKCGKVLAQLRRAADEFKRQIMTMDEEMKKAVDDVKKDYIDIPEDSPASTDSGVSSENSEISETGDGPDVSDYDEHPDGFYDETKYDYDGSYGYDGGDDSGPVLGEPDGSSPVEPVEEEVKSDADATTPQ